MTKDDIIKLARESGLGKVFDEHAHEYRNCWFENSEYPELLAFADLVAAAELRQLHERNQELLEALKDAAEVLEIASAGGGVDFYAYAKTARAAIAKATGGTA
jgi:hypothetical protein